MTADDVREAVLEAYGAEIIEFLTPAGLRIADCCSPRRHDGEVLLAAIAQTLPSWGGSI